MASKDAPAVEFGLTYIKENQVKYPLEIQANMKNDYFEKRSNFSIMSLLKNPMVLMFGFALFSMVLMPKLMSGLDEETLKEMKKEQGSMQNMMNKATTGDFSQMFSNFLAENQMQQNKNKRK